MISLFPSPHLHHPPFRTALFLGLLYMAPGENPCCRAAPTSSWLQSVLTAGRIENETVWWKLVVGGHSRRRRRRRNRWWWWCWWWCWCWWELDYDTGYMTEITWFSNKHSSLQLMGVGSQLWLYAWAAWAATIQAWMHLPAALASLNVPNHLPKLPCDKHWKLLRIPTPSDHHCQNLMLLDSQTLKILESQSPKNRKIL